MMRVLLPMLLAWLVCSSAPALAGPADIVGTWRLVSISATLDDGRVVHGQFGEHPNGLLTYTADGRMMTILTEEGRPRLSGDRLSSPPEEKAKAFTSLAAYAGSYTYVDGEVTHVLETASVENWVGSKLKRRATVEGDRLTLLAPMQVRHGVMQNFTQIWRRLP